MTATILHFRRPLRLVQSRDGINLRAEGGLVRIEFMPGQWRDFEPADARVLAYALDTLAGTADAQREDGRSDK